MCCVTKNCTNSLLSSILWVVREAILLFLSNWFHLRVGWRSVRRDFREEALLVHFDNDLFRNDVETDKEIGIIDDIKGRFIQEYCEKRSKQCYKYEKSSTGASN